MRRRFALAAIAAIVMLAACGREPPALPPATDGAAKAEAEKVAAEIARTEREIAGEEAEVERLRRELAALGPAAAPRVVVTRVVPRAQEYDPTLRREIVKRPEIEDPAVERPVVILDEEEELIELRDPGRPLAPEPPKGGEVLDAFGVGGGDPGPYGQRWGKAVLAREGGSEATEAAVQAALHWLARRQEPDGAWLAADSRFDVSVTAVAVLAFTGNGHTHRHSKESAFRKAQNHGVDTLKRSRQNDGSLGFDAAKPETIVNHALALWALADIFACSRDLVLRKYVQQGVDFAVAARNPGGGWGRGVRARPDDPGLTALFVIALATARTAEVSVPQAALDEAIAALDAAPEDPGTAGVAVLARVLAGRKPGDMAVQKGLRALVVAPPAKDAERVDLAAFCAGVHGVFQATASGAPEWKAWNEALQAALLPRQQQAGPDAGSFDPAADARGAIGGRAYATAVAALALEVYYRLERPRPGR